MVGYFWNSNFQDLGYLFGIIKNKFPIVPFNVHANKAETDYVYQRVVVERVVDYHWWLLIEAQRQISDFCKGFLTFSATISPL